MQVACHRVATCGRAARLSGQVPGAAQGLRWQCSGALGFILSALSSLGGGH